MKRDGIATFLNILLALGLLASVIVCGMYVQHSRGYRADAAKAAAIRNLQNFLQALAVDCVTYSKTNADLVPILDSVGWTSAKPAAPAAATTPAKPATK